MTTQMNVRIDTSVKEQAEELLQELGLNMSTAINIFMRALIREKGLPFEVKKVREFSEAEIKRIDEALLRSEQEILEGKTVDAHEYLKNKRQELMKLKDMQD